MRVNMLGVSRRLVQRLGRRAYSEELLKEEERAAENLYIKKMEKERMERLRREAGKDGSHAGEDTASDGTPKTPEEASMVRNKAIALGASAVALFSVGYWVLSSAPSSKKDKEQE